MNKKDLYYIVAKIIKDVTANVEEKEVKDYLINLASLYASKVLESSTLVVDEDITNIVFKFQGLQLTEFEETVTEEDLDILLDCIVEEAGEWTIYTLNLRGDPALSMSDDNVYDLLKLFINDYNWKYAVLMHCDGKRIHIRKSKKLLNELDSTTIYTMETLEPIIRKYHEFHIKGSNESFVLFSDVYKYMLELEEPCVVVNSAGVERELNPEECNCIIDNMFDLLPVATVSKYRDNWGIPTKIQMIDDFLLDHPELFK